MADLHRLLQATPQTPSDQGGEAALGVAEALHRARLGVLKNPARREPWFWAAFLVMGIEER